MGRNKASCIHLLPVPQTYQRRNWHAFDIRAIAWRYTRVTTFISPLLLHRQQHVVTASGSNAYAINLSVRAGSPYVSGTFRFKTVYNVEQPPQFSLSTYFQNCVHEKKKRSVRIRQIVRDKSKSQYLPYVYAPFSNYTFESPSSLLTRGSLQSRTFLQLIINSIEDYSKL